MRAGILAATLAVSCAAASIATASAATQRGSITNDPTLDYKLRSMRAVHAHEELQKVADELLDLSTGLAKQVADRGALGPNDGKTLDRIRKLAKRIRSEMGGSGDPQLDNAPQTLGDATAALSMRGEALAEQVDRSTRYEVNMKLIRLAGEIMLLSDFIKRFRE